MGISFRHGFDCNCCDDEPPHYGPPRPPKCLWCENRRRVEAIWCDDCLAKERHEVMRVKTKIMLHRQISKQEHDRLMTYERMMREAQE